MADPGRLLGVGIATLDIVNRVATYPAEDTEVRALGQRLVRGGNNANTLAVLADLGHRCGFVGTLADDAGADLITADLAGHGVALGDARRIAGASTPTSYIAVSAATGSRTIVHHRDLPELTATEFDQIDLADCTWVHFEGRNCRATTHMVARVHRERPGLAVSIEIEKPRPDLSALLAWDAAPGPQRGARGPRILILARAYATAIGITDPRAFLTTIAARSAADLLVAPWGADGAWALIRGQAPIHAPAHPPTRLIDTLGAGDVFNAAIIDGLHAGLRCGFRSGDEPNGWPDCGPDCAPDCAQALDLPTVLTRANRLAGHACGREGLTGLVASARTAGWS